MAHVDIETLCEAAPCVDFLCENDARNLQDNNMVSSSVSSAMSAVRYFGISQDTARPMDSEQRAEAFVWELYVTLRDYEYV